MFYVYLHIQQDTGKPFYVGKGKGNRAYDDNRSLWWKNVANKHGWKAVIICDDLTEKEAFEVEKFYIKEYGRRDLGTGTLVNMTDGGDGSAGLKFSDESRKRLSDSHKGKPSNWKGKSPSDETRKKISDAKKGKPSSMRGKFHSEQSRKKMSESASGRKISEETRKKMSNSHKGSKPSEETLKKMSDSQKGRVFSEEHRKKMSESAKRRHQNNKLEL